MSTYKLAQQYKAIPVVGIDRSGHRLDKVLEVESVVVKESAKIQSENAILVRAELSDFWLLVFQDPSLIVYRHYLLYPNPYPKSKHLQRRWHGHPTFPVLLGLGELTS
jgi:tRNA (guanine-N7-)-methyltransferase